MNTLQLVIANKRYSSWSLRPWLALSHFDVPFDETVIPLDQETTSAAIHEHSPAGKVPVLHHGDITVWESLAILEYLADAFYDRPWWPTDPHAKAHARTVSAEMHAGFGALREALTMDVLTQYEPRAWDAGVAKDIARIQDMWCDCRKRFGASGDFLFGDFTIADAMFAPVATRIKTYAVEMDETCSAYVDAVLDLPAMQKWIDEAKEEPWVIEKFARPV